MGNNLNENIEGRYVVLLPSYFKSRTLAEDIRERVFLAEGGFGCTSNSMGNAVFGQFAVDGEETRVEGYELERFATDQEIDLAFAERQKRQERFDVQGIPMSIPSDAPVLSKQVWERV